MSLEQGKKTQIKFGYAVSECVDVETPYETTRQMLKELGLLKD